MVFVHEQPDLSNAEVVEPTDAAEIVVNTDGSVTVLVVDPEALTGYVEEGFHGEHNPENAGDQ